MVVIAVITTAVLVTKKLTGRKQVNPADVKVPEYVKVDLLTPNKYSRPQTPLEKVNGIVVHYVANPCSTALENRNYFEGLKDQTGSKTTSASSHFVIGLEEKWYSVFRSMRSPTPQQQEQRHDLHRVLSSGRDRKIL